MRLAVRVENDVAGLQVAVDDARFVGVVKGVGDLGAQFRRLPKREPLRRQPIRQRRPSTKSLTMKTVSSSRPTSWTLTMFGCRN